MPISVKRVKGHEYLYFSYYDREERTKKEVYMGPKKSARAIHKALQYNREYLNLQQGAIQSKYRRIDKYVNVLSNEVTEEDSRIKLDSSEA